MGCFIPSLVSKCQKSSVLLNQHLSFPAGDKNALQNIILYHLTPGVYIGKGFEPGVTNILKTTQGSKIYLKGVSYYKGFTKYFLIIKWFPYSFSLTSPLLLKGEWDAPGEWVEVQRIWHHDNQRCHSRRRQTPLPSRSVLTECTDGWDTVQHELSFDDPFTSLPYPLNISLRRHPSWQWSALGNTEQTDKIHPNQGTERCWTLLLVSWAGVGWLIYKN